MTATIHSNKLLVHDHSAAEPYPWFWKLFGVLCILGGLGAAGNMVLGAYELAMRGQLEAAAREYTATTVVIAIVAVCLSVALAGMFFLLGVRMLRDKRHKAALLANIMIFAGVALIVCEFMIWGLSPRLLPAYFIVVILVVVQSYSDPSLREERQLQRTLRKMEDRSAGEAGTLGRDMTGRGYIKLNFFNLFWIYVIACVAGLVVEIAWHMIVVDPGVYQSRAGLVYGPFSPIYGVGAVLMTMALNRFHKANPVVIFVVAALIGGGFEFAVSWFMETAFGIVAWDYSDRPLNIAGRTSVRYMCMWGALGLVWVRYATPLLLKLVNMIPWDWRYTVTTVCAVLMFADSLLTLSAYDCWYQRQAGTMDYGNTTAITRFCNDHYDDTFMDEHFQTMTMDPSAASRAN